MFRVWGKIQTVQQGGSIVTDRARYWGLLTGINYYHRPEISNLRFAVNDAQELRQLLTSSPYSFLPNQVSLLESSDPQHDQAMRRNVLRELRRMARSAQEKDTLLFYYSGHGAVLQNRPYLCPSDTEPDELFEDTIIPLAHVRDIIETSAAAVKILIFDACHLGVRLGDKAAVESAQEFVNQAKQVFQDVRGIAMLASSALEEISIERAEKKHGVFTYYLLEALHNQGAVDRNGDARLSVMEVFQYVALRVRNYGQQPTVLLEGSGELDLFPVPTRPSVSNPVRRVFPSPVKAGEDFFGRSEELRRAGETLVHTSDILILVHGERCIGKTTLLNRLKTLLDEKASSSETPCFSFSIEPAGIRILDDFARELRDGVQRVCQAVASSDVSGDRAFSFTTFSRFGAEIEDLLRFVRSSRFFIFLDEFDKLWQATDNVTANQVMGLLRYIVEQTNLPVAFVVSSLKDPELFWTSFGSPPASLTLYLSPLDRGDCDAMLASFFTEESTRRNELFAQIYLASGGHPYFAKLLAAEVFDRLIQGARLEDVLSTPGWEQILNRAAATPEATDVLKFIYEQLSDDQRYVLLSVAARADCAVTGDEAVRWRVSQRVAARKLEQRAYLIPLADGGYRLRLLLLGQWLKPWPELALESERLGVIPAAPINQQGICIDERSGKVYLDARVIETELPNLQYQALLHLARNAGRVVAREEMYEALHRKDEAYLPTDQSLDALVYRLRLAVGDKEQRYLKTLRKRGYQLTQGTVIPSR